MSKSLLLIVSSLRVRDSLRFLPALTPLTPVCMASIVFPCSVKVFGRARDEQRYPYVEVNADCVGEKTLVRAPVYHKMRRLRDLNPGTSNYDTTSNSCSNKANMRSSEYADAHAAFVVLLLIQVAMSSNSPDVVALQESLRRKQGRISDLKASIRTSKAELAGVQESTRCAREDVVGVNSEGKAFNHGKDALRVIVASKRQFEEARVRIISSSCLADS